MSLDSLPTWLVEALGLQRDLNHGQTCAQDLQVLYSSGQNEYLLVPTFCRRRTCPACAAVQARDRIARMRAALGALTLPTHVVLTLPNRGCRAGCLREWLSRLTNARKRFLTRNQKHRALGRIPVLDWYVWKIEVTWSTDNSWWHPHLHVLADDWLTRPYPEALRKPTTRSTRATIASYLRLRWADCLRGAGLPTPKYPWQWKPGDTSPNSLNQLVKIVSWDPSTADRDDVLHELAKYVTKPQVLSSFSPSLEAEYKTALGGKASRIRTWQPRRGWLQPKKTGNGDYTYIGSLRRMTAPHVALRDPGEYYTAIELSERLRAQLSSPQE